MKKVLSGFFISLCILMLMGYGQLYTHASESTTLTQPAGGSGIFSFENLHHHPTSTIKNSTHGTDHEREKIAIEEREKEEDKRICSKKCAGISQHFTNLFYSHLSRSYFRYIRKSVPLLRYFRRSTSFTPHDSLNLLFCVVRI